MIRRAARPKAQFTIIANSVLLDTRLSYRARGLLAAILARPDHWRVRSDQLASEGREGRDAVRAALSELKEHGYLTVETLRQTDGTFITEQVVYDQPVDATKPLVAPETEKPAPDNQASENQAPDSQALLQELVVSTESKKEHMLTVPVSEKPVDLEFEQFWAFYPRKVGKTKAVKVWQRLSRADRGLAFDALKKHVELWRRKQVAQEFIPHPTSWLNGRRWEDEIDSELQTSKQTLGLSKTAQRIQEMMNDAINRESQNRRLPSGADLWVD